MKVLKTILEQYRNGERGMPTYDELAAIAGSDHDGHAQINGGDCRAQPVAWVRYCSDGTFEGPIMDTDIRMAGSRRTSGAWTPLYAHPAEATRAKDLHHTLAVARDHMRVMANWIKRRDDPVAYDWATDAITIVNAVLERGEQQ